MRMNSVAGTVTIRVCKEDCTLGGGKYRIPAGTGMWRLPRQMANAVWQGHVHIHLAACVRHVESDCQPLRILIISLYFIPLHSPVTPAATGMWTPIYAVHNNDAVWPDADKFQPERWLEPGADYVQSPAAGSAAGGESGQQQVSRAPGGGDASGCPHGSGSAVGSKALNFEMNISRVKVSSLGMV